MSDHERIRNIVARAGRETTDPFCRSWFERDENGYWERKVRALLAEKADKIEALGLTEAQVDEELAAFIRLGALKARMSDLKRSPRTKDRRRA